MAVTALILGLKPTPEISFHDALVVLYLLALCWATNICALASCNSVRGDARALQLFSVIQSIAVFSFALAILITAPTFGSTPECNRHAKLVVFTQFRVFDAGRILGWIVAVAVIVGYTGMTAKDYITDPRNIFRRKKAEMGLPGEMGGSGKPEPVEAPSLDIKAEPEEDPIEPYRQANLKWKAEAQVYQPNVDGMLMLQLGAIAVLWALAVMNTELLIVWNLFGKVDSTVTTDITDTVDPTPSIWQFGQILPLLLVVLPMVGMVTAFQTYGIRKGAKKEDKKTT
ncbi:hypothetical protein FIBSPDRAFT_221570 [Athelia psychrophila]|uniref:Uncharacterized protein n=1 Tax=Athelia psychrophila TaxID=1759441 RepID=A0A165YZZ6_9AGAM|nr:hypothetical protein FIBSPDRAFT_221570 [Fibularhizoctonia sp. CBS 109695]